VPDVEAYDDVRAARSPSVSGLGADEDDAAPLVPDRRQDRTAVERVAQPLVELHAAADGAGLEDPALAIRRHVVRASTAQEPETFELYDGLSVAAFYTALRAALSRFAIDVPILAEPYGFPGQSTPFAEDHANHAYDAAAVRRFWNAIAWTTSVFERFATEFAGKQGPVQLFWHGFDLALGRYSGRRADGPPKSDLVQREAYSHEVIAFGFWPGDANVPAPAYYTYTAPEPAELTTMALAPSGASWAPSGSGHMGILAYDAVRTSDDPQAALLAFLRSGYDAGTRTARWDAAALSHTG
jgi:hypothetical protein